MLKDIFETMLLNKDIKIRDRDVSVMLPREVKEFRAEVAKVIDRPRIRKMDTIYDLFGSGNVIPYPNVDGILEKEMQPGVLYSLRLKDYQTHTHGSRGSTRFDYLLFLNIIRDGQRFTVPVYKSFELGDNTLNTMIVNTRFTLEIDVEPDDQFIIVKGDTFMTVVKEIKDQAAFKKNIQYDQVGSAGSFDKDKI